MGQEKSFNNYSYNINENGIGNGSEKTFGVTKEDLIEALKKVIDPELGINVYDLGLIYDIQAEEGDVTIIMTLTTPGCPLHDSITSGVKYAIEKFNGVKKAHVQLVWAPPWNPSMMSQTARELLGRG